MSGSSGQGGYSVARLNSPFLSARDNQNISSNLSSYGWNGSNITYSFPTASSQYGTSGTYPDSAPFNNLSALSAAQMTDTVRAFGLISSYSNLTFTQITETDTTHATIRLANSSTPPTAYAYYPSNAATGGDVFFGATGRNPAVGNFDSGQAVLHEIGHAMGLKHGQDTGTYGVTSADRLDIEFSLMNYPNYIGSREGYATASSSTQSYMMYDIAALQYMYGANFSKTGANETYQWSAATGQQSVNGAGLPTPFSNRIFETIWTGGSNSTYDLSNFAQNQVDDMNPGSWMRFSDSQLADLAANGTPGPGKVLARGNVYNALLYNGDQRSLIRNLKTGSGNDTITGNDTDNVINAGAGNNVVDGGAGSNTIDYSTSSAKVRVDLAAGNAAHDNGQNDSITNFQNAIGSDFGDRLYGTAGNNLFTLGTGANIVYGEGGSDTVDYSRSNSVLYVDLGGRYSTHDGNTDYLIGISNASGNNASGNRFYGTAGNNVFSLGTGSNIVYGQGGTDTADYTRSSSALYVDLAGRYANHDGVTDNLIGISNTVANNASGSRFYGTAGDNVFSLGTGSSIVYGEGGNDSVDYSRSITVLYVDLQARYASHDGETDNLIGISNVTGNSASGNRFYGTAGNNVFTLGLGQNIVYGQGGNDTVNYSRSSTAVYADIYGSGNSGYATHDGVTDALIGITNVTGSAQDDRIYGARSGGAMLSGGDGSDIIYDFGGGNTVDGGAGNDKLVTSGNDTLTGGDGADAFIFSSLHAADTITDFNSAAGDRINVRQGVFGGFTAGSLVTFIRGAGNTLFSDFSTSDAFGFDTALHDLMFHAASGTVTTLAHMGSNVTSMAAVDLTVYTG